jgi:hypothetical protein
MQLLCMLGIPFAKQLHLLPNSCAAIHRQLSKRATATPQTPWLQAVFTCAVCLNYQVYKSTNGIEQSITSKGKTLKETATSSSDCVAVRNQLFPDAGTSYALDDLAPWTSLGSGMTMSQVSSSNDARQNVAVAMAALYAHLLACSASLKISMHFHCICVAIMHAVYCCYQGHLLLLLLPMLLPRQCIDNCEPGKCCFAQLQYLSTGSTGTCSVMSLDPATSTARRWQLMYKLVPSDAIAAFAKRNNSSSSSSDGNVTAKMMSSTSYQVSATCELQPVKSPSNSPCRVHTHQHASACHCSTVGRNLTIPCCSELTTHTHTGSPSTLLTHLPLTTLPFFLSHLQSTSVCTANHCAGLHHCQLGDPGS